MKHFDNRLQAVRQQPLYRGLQYLHCPEEVEKKHMQIES